jgi:hypothetical protein
VTGSTGTTEPVGSPPLAGHAPGVYIALPADVLPTAEPASPSTQSGAFEPTKSELTVVEQVASEYTDTSAEHVLPLGDPQAHAEQLRVSSAVWS